MEKEQSRFIIQRFDNYITGANTKGNFLLAFNTLFCGVIIANYKTIITFIQNPNDYYLVNICLCVLIVACIIATIFIIKAVYPFLKSGNSSKDKYHSHIFFNSVAEFKNETDFYDSYSKLTDENVEEDLSKQAYQLAKGLKKKYCFIKWAMIFVYVELTVLIALITILIFY
jgi:hypothetical protein